MTKQAHRAAMRTLAEEALAVLHEIRDRMPERRPESCCGDCPPIAGGGYDCTCDEECERSTQDAPAGRIGWWRVSPSDGDFLVREVEAGWSRDESDIPDFRADTYPDAVFTPIATLPEGYVAVEREDVRVLLGYVLPPDLRAALDEGADDA